MTFLITNASRETIVVGIIILLALTISARRSKGSAFFSLQTTTEIRGLAILMVVFSHIGYFLVSDRSFLVPLSNYGGVGVDLFLILSGYGLVASALQRPISIGKFYLKRLQRICLPVALTILLFLALDFVWLRQTYPLKSIIQNILGLFPSANIYADINSPLWYITPLLFFSLLFPLLFRRRFPVLSAMAMAVIGWFTIRYISQLNIFSEVVLSLYKLHFLSFPLGMAIGGLVNQPLVSIAKIAERINILLKKYNLTTILRLGLLVFAGAVFIYTFYNSGVGESWKREAVTSLITALAILTLFVFKKINFKLLTLFGLFSFEIYLLHWPLLYRYNFLFDKISAGTATIIYLALFLGIGFLYQKAVSKIFPPAKVCTVLQD